MQNDFDFPKLRKSLGIFISKYEVSKYYIYTYYIYIYTCYIYIYIYIIDR